MPCGQTKMFESGSPAGAAICDAPPIAVIGRAVRSWRAAASQLSDGRAGRALGRAVRGVWPRWDGELRIRAASDCEGRIKRRKSNNQAKSADQHLGSYSSSWQLTDVGALCTDNLPICFSNHQPPTSSTPLRASSPSRPCNGRRLGFCLNQIRTSPSV